MRLRDRLIGVLVKREVFVACLVWIVVWIVVERIRFRSDFGLHVLFYIDLGERAFDLVIGTVNLRSLEYRFGKAQGIPCGGKCVFRQCTDESDRKVVAHGRIDRRAKEHMRFLRDMFLQAAHQ